MRQTVVWLVVLFCLVAVLPAMASQFKRIRDISVSCNDALTCDVSAYNAQSELYTVTFRRRASPDAPVELVLGVRETLTPGSDVLLEIDGAEIVRLPVADLSYRAAVYEYLFRGREEIAALMGSAKTGRTLRVSYRTRGVDTVSRFSLAGFVAGLIFMDEVQGRVGRPDALQADGPGTSGGEGTIREVVSFSDIPFQLRSEFTSPSGSCGGLQEQPFAKLGGFDAEAGAGVRLIGLPCGSGDAFNQPYAFWERDGPRFNRVAFPVIAEEGPSTSSTAWNVEWDDERKILTSLFKGRAAGDCGILNRWAWKTGESENAFVLIEARATAECGSGDPQSWPIVWPVGG
ncbi:DUF1176 domain-containing protein [Oricola cellulosilytica]|uniref:DUF1176 domain-containing protein n=1 Tax=Oricola cellulosilytica TaxID=1429082 RepID=UPI001304EBF7|nr:DUF1176 domain-containing protein [Oricola cellulosilytica]